MFKPQKKVSTSSQEQAINWNAHLSVSEYTTRRMTFGRYVNIQIKDLPDSYLEWGVLNLNNIWSEYLLREWKRRNPNWRALVKKSAQNHTI